MDNPQVTDTQIAWLAGILDGEGSITMGYDKKKHYTPMIAVVNTNPEMIFEVCRILNELGCAFHAAARGDNRGSLGEKTCWQIQVHRLTSVEKILRRITPWLIAKKSRAQLMLVFVSSRIPKLNIKPRGRGSPSPYSEEEIKVGERIRHLNDCTQDSEKEKIQSELRGKLAELAEMTNRLGRMEYSG